MNRAETYLQESGESKRSLSSAYAALFHEHPQPMWMWSYATRRVCAANPALLSLLGYPQDRPGTVDIGRILPEQSAAFLETLGADDPLPHVHRVALCGADERIRDFEASFRILVDPDTKTRYVAAIVDSLQSESADRASAGEDAVLVEDDIADRRQAPRSDGGLELVNRRLSFLLEASALLTENLDYESSLRKVAQIAVPKIADWCAVDILDGSGALKRLAVVHNDPAKIELAFEIERKYPADPNADRGVYHSLRTGEPEYIPEIPDELLTAATRDAEHLRLARELGLRSVILTPLASRGSTIGALTLVMAESGRTYTADDLELATELARRAAIYIENSRLYSDMQAEVRLQTADLRAVNQELESFTYSVSHDLRSPLRHLSGFLQLLKQSYGKNLDAKGNHYLDTVLDASRRMGVLIDDLLAFSRIGRADLDLRAVDLSQLVDKIVEEVKHDRSQREIEWTIDRLPVVTGDPSMLALVFQNLIDNAVKFTARRDLAAIRVKSEAREDEIVLTVSDNGAGFDERYSNKLFGVFQRLHSRNEFEGTGIGLANVRRIVERHHGHVWATGKIGIGATFSFSLPIANKQETKK